MKQNSKFEESYPVDVSLCSYVNNKYEYRAMLYEFMFTLDILYEVDSTEVKNKNGMIKMIHFIMDDKLYTPSMIDDLLNCNSNGRLFVDDLWHLFSNRHGL